MKLAALIALALSAHAAVQPPEQYFGFRIGADKKLVRWDKIVDYMQMVAAGSGRVRFRNLGPTTSGNPFVLLEISSAENLRNLDRIKALERKLYFQGGAPTDAERDEIFRSAKSVVFISNNIHSTEIGASQMVIELVYDLATSDSPRVKKILDNVVLLLEPSLNPDGQIMVTDWYNKTLGTPAEASPLPYLYHPYTGHDNNRDMYLFSQRESRMTADVLWHEWFPAIWLDEHQQGTSGPRIFTMPATDPINPNVDPLIYRLNGVYGQSQAAALEAEGKTGIIFNSTYTNFWQGAMAWAGWWHNQVGLLTEVASARIATPIVQQKADPSRAANSAPQTGGRGAATGANAPSDFESERRRMMEHPDDPLPAPRDITPRTEYPRPWLGGKWTLRDIVDYELIATNALLEAAADTRETLLRQIYNINRNTIEAGKKGELGQDKDKLYAAIIPAADQHDPNEAIELVDKLLIAGVGWTRFVLDRYEWTYTRLHNEDIKAGRLRARFDAIILPDQRETAILEGLDFKTILEQYRGGIGETGWESLRQFVADGGTLVALGEASNLLLDKMPLPVKDLKKSLTRDQHFAPGTIVNLQVDTAHPLGRGIAADTWGYYINSPFFQLTEGFASQKVSVAARYPNTKVNASGWLRGEDLMYGRAAVVAVEMNPGKVVLFGMLFNALYWSAEGDLSSAKVQ